MVDYKRILRLRAEGVSRRGIAEVLGCSRNTVAAVLAAATAAGVGFGEVADLAADEIRHRLSPAPIRPESDRVQPDFEHVHRELGRTPGESIEVDWAGDAMSFADPLTAAATQAWLFVAALSFSAFTYVEAFTDMTLVSWIDAHVHAFEAFGGTARLLVPDNLRTGVLRADRYEPALNPAYAGLAEHYGTVIVPARVKRPRDYPEDLVIPSVRR